MKFVDTEQTDWDLYLDAILFSYRVSRQDSTKHSPFLLVYGRQPRLPIEFNTKPDEHCSDSLRLGLSTSVKRTIANLLHTNKPTIVIQQARMQLQSGGADCGLFAIATATAICNGQDPENIRFDQRQMRQHLLKCLDDKLLLPFPSTKAPKKRPETATRQRIHVYCICRLPDDGRKMIQCTSCKQWYHCNCMKLSQRMIKSIEDIKKPWYCGTPCHAK